MSWLVALSVPAWPAAAQERGTVEAGAYLRFTEYDNSLGFDNTVGPGGRLAVFVLRGLAIEADLSRTSTENPGGASVTHTPLRVMVQYSAPTGRGVHLVVGAGYLRNRYGGDLDVTEQGLAGTIGLRVRLRDMVSLRVDASGDYIGHPANQDQHNVLNRNLGFQAGVSLLVNPLRRGGS
ncbi:MAG TPA: outer membrane beta-barrel protein [Gemmatimonadales bacterium]|nr:outer membrane beta-barrel protein [Gemmatimonadales bacterium]